MHGLLRHSLLVGLSLGWLGEQGNALLCTTQNSRSEVDWKNEEKECNTFCVIAFGKTTLVNDFEQPNPVCLAAGCAKLKGDGSVDTDGMIEAVPMQGSVRFFKCDNSSFALFPEQISATYPNPCNLYAELTSKSSNCQHLGKAQEVLQTQVEPSFFQQHKLKIIIGSAVLLSVPVLVALFFAHRRTVDKRMEDKEKKQVSVDVEEGSPRQFAGSFDGLSGQGAPRSPALTLEPTEKALASIPSHYAPGSATYEKYHACLSEIYRLKGGDLDKVDGVLQSYLLQEGGLENLNKKLKAKFGPELKTIREKLGLGLPKPDDGTKSSAQPYDW